MSIKQNCANVISIFCFYCNLQRKLTKNLVLNLQVYELRIEININIQKIKIHIIHIKNLTINK